MREKIFYIDTPPILLSKISDQSNFFIDFNLSNDNFTGRFSIELNQEKIEFDTNYDAIDIAIACNGLIVSVKSDIELKEIDFIKQAYYSVTEYTAIFLNYLQTELNQYWCEIGIKNWGLVDLLSKTVKKESQYSEDTLKIPFGLGDNEKMPFFARERKYLEISEGLSENHTSVIKSWFENKTKPDLSKHLLSLSKLSLSNGDYRISSILAITSLEPLLKSFTKKDKVNCGLKVMKNNNTDEITDWLINWLAQNATWHEEIIDGSKILEWADDLNKARNKAIHRGKTPEFDTVDRGVFSVEALREFILSTKINKLSQK